MSKSGDLLHPELEHTVIKEKVATPELLQDLIQQGVDLNEDWKSWYEHGCTCYAVPNNIVTMNFTVYSYTDIGVEKK